MDNNDNLAQQVDGEYQRSHFFDYLYILVRRRKFIVTTILATALITAAITLLMPNWYAATASVLPPKRPGGLLSILESGVGSVLKNIPGLGGRLGGSSEVYSYMAILQSRTAMERVVHKFDLLKVYKIDDNKMEKAIRTLTANCEFDFANEGNITITVYDKEPQRASDMANYFIELLNEISVDLGTREAKNNREFVEKRYQQNLRDLKMAEDSLKAFQQKTGIYALPEQTASAIKAATEMKTEALAKEVEYGLAKRTLGADNPRTQSLQMQMAEINKQLLEMKYGASDADQSLSLFVPFKNIPELGTMYVRLFREFQIQSKLMEYLLPLYEQAKIDEQKDTPVVLVLDKAVPPERKARPKRSLIVLIFMALATLFATTWVFVAEIYEREKGRNEKVAAIGDELRRGKFLRKVMRRIE